MGHTLLNPIIALALVAVAPSPVAAQGKVKVSKRLKTNAKKRKRTASRRPRANAKSGKTRRAKASPKTGRAKASPKTRRAKASPKTRRAKASPKTRRAKASPKTRRAKASPKTRRAKASPKTRRRARWAKRRYARRCKTRRARRTPRCQRLARLAQPRKARRPRYVCRWKGKDRFPPMKLYHANRRRRLSLRLYDKCGKRLKSASRKLRHFLRCLRTQRSHAIHPRLISNLYTVSRAFKGRELVVYSGYRHSHASKLKASYHHQGRAIDFRVRGVSNKRLRDFALRRFAKSGVGYYPNVPFVHLDARPKRGAFWIDFSGSGERARYAKNARKLLRMERRGIPIRERRTVVVIIAEGPAHGTPVPMARLLKAPTANMGHHEQAPLARRHRLSRRALSTVRRALSPLLPTSRFQAQRKRRRSEEPPALHRVAPIRPLVPPMPALPRSTIVAPSDLASTPQAMTRRSSRNRRGRGE